MVSFCVCGCGRLFIRVAVRLVRIRFITRAREGRSTGPAESGSGYKSNNAREPILNNSLLNSAITRAHTITDILHRINLATT